MLRKIALWIDERLYVSKLYASTAGHSVPKNAESWFYVFGLSLIHISEPTRQAESRMPSSA